MEALTRSRATIKAKATRFATFFNNLANRNTGKSAELRERMAHFEPLLSQYDIIQDQIEAACQNSEESITQAEERNKFESDYYKYLAAAREWLAMNSVAQIGASQVENNGINASIVKRLPTITVPTFNGNLKDWIKFRDSFDSLVNRQTTLSNIDKFNYLNNALEDEAARVIQTLGISDANYEHAWAKLKERYEDSNQLLDYHTQAFCELPSLQRATYVELRRLIDDANNHLLALKSLDETAVQCDSLLIYIIRKKLDPETRSQWDRKALSLEKRTFNDFKIVVENHCKYLQCTFNEKQASAAPGREGLTKHNNRTTNRQATHTITKKCCPICNDNHPTYSCETLKALSVSQRIQKIKELQLCYNCLNAGHSNRTCNLGPCRKCHKKHNSLLHLEKNTPNSAPISATVASESSINNQPAALMAQSNPRNVSHVLLGTAVVHVQDRDGNFQECRALLDSGSQVHLATKALCEKLNLSTTASETTVSGINQSSIDIARCAKVKIQSMATGFKATISCLVTPRITDDMPNMVISHSGFNIPPGLVLADPQFTQSRPIDLLIGSGIFWDLLCVGQIKKGYDQPILQKTKLGWIATGPIQDTRPVYKKRAACHIATTSDLHNLVEKFWKTENCAPSTGPPTLDSNHPCEQHFNRTVSRDNSGRFIVRIPFNDTIKTLGDSREMAHKRLLAMERKFCKDPILKETYVKFMQEYEDLGHMTEVSDEEIESRNPTYYLPHHAVRKEDSTTTKLRVVFDGSAKSSSGISLNETQLVGPTIQDELFNIVIRFRKHKFVICADVTKMYRQMLVSHDQRDLQRILFRADSSQPIKTYRLNTVTYGTASASFLATRCLREIGENCKQSYPNASKSIIGDFYVDDLITGADSIEDALRLKEDINLQLQTAGLELRKWASNEPLILQTESPPVLKIQADKDPKTLGLNWNTQSDCLIFSVSNADGKVSKRTILSKIAQIFDPLGLVGPVTARAKIILQKLWQLKLDWDESLPQELHTTWVEFQQHLPELRHIEIPRRAIGDKPISIELHGFCDASESAFGACIYLRATDSSGRHTIRLLCAKSRVAPLQKVSLPRLELCGSLLLAQLTHKVVGALDITLNNSYFWSDSMIVLAWIKAPSSRWKTFVANRTSEIQELVGTDWRHVASEHNPADLLSRGVSPSELAKSTLWWQGPHWLSEDSCNWPTPSVEQPTGISEERKTHNTFVTAASSKLDLLARSSSWSHLMRVTAYILRFINNVRKSRNNANERIIDFLTTNELKQARLRLLQAAQAEMFPHDIKELKRGNHVLNSSQLASLSPFLDNHDALMRVGGRLINAPIPYDQKHPIILSSSHHITKLIIKHEHLRLLHGGCQTVLASLRARYWPLNGKNTVRGVLRKCITCIRFKGAGTQYIMGNLPASRVTPSRAFLTTGVDYAGPFFIKEKSRSKISIKTYICIFVCFSTKAIHIELAHDLSTDAFLNCLRRFVSRRGRCQHLYSDNGTNFVGARNELSELSELFKKEKVLDSIYHFSAKHGMSWHMIPPRAPNFGGLWESAVKSAKFHLKRIVGDTKLTFEELYTVLTQVEACLNSRPLSPISNDPNDLTPLTPGHFLIGEAIMTVPDPDVRDVPINRLNRYQHLQYMLQHFWQRWQREYLQHLQQRHKWHRSHENNLTPGTLVILREDNLPPTRWRLGRIIEEFPGQDHVTRVVSVKVADGIIVRAVSKIIPLPTETEDQAT